ncbi:MAG TPA: PKD domain-containing protein [Phnomibacter sp.]|nr:PKD domain-containing protein [Phnomibacter sp.]
MFAFSNSRGQLSADFSASPTSGCAPILVTFTDLSTGNPDSWKWDLGNGVTAAVRNPSTTYFAPGVYTVKLTVYKGVDSAVIVKPTYITVYDLPKVAFGAVPVSGCIPHTVQFTDRSTTSSGTITNWVWDFGDGSLGSGANPVHTYANTGSYRVTLTVTTSNGCTSNTSIDNYINIFPPLRADFDAVVPNSCTLPVTVPFSDRSVGTNIVSWNWDFGDGNTSNLRNPTHVYTAGGSYDVKLVVRNAAGCVDSMIRPSFVNVANLTASYNLGTGTFCTNQPVAIQNVSIPVAQLDSTEWAFSDGVVLKQRDAVRVHAAPGTFNFRMVVFRGGCSDTTFGTYTVMVKPASGFSSNVTTSCKIPQDVTFTNTTPNSTVVSWNFGNGVTSTAQNPTATYTQFGNYTVTMILQHDNGCMDTVVQTNLVQIAPPTITAVAGLPYDGCLPYSNTFIPTVNAIEPVAQWHWDFGDGTTANVEQPFKTFNTPGAYAVVLTITTVGGCMQTFTSQVRVASKPVANFSATPLNVCASDPVAFTDMSTGTITSWRWEFGDGGSSGSQNPTYTFNDTGSMYVRLIVSNDNCRDTLFRPNYIYVRPPIADFTLAMDCSSPYTYSFNNISKGADTWQWNFGDGNTSTVFSPTHVYTATGQYNVQLVVNNGTCSHQFTRTIAVLDEKANIEWENAGGCNSSLYRFYARGPQTNPANISRYEWSINNGPVITTTTNLLEQTFTDTGFVQVQLIIRDNNGCADTTVQNVHISTVGTIVNFGPLNQQVCVGNVVSFSDSTKYHPSNPVVRWEWNFGVGSDSVFTAGPFRKQYDSAGVFDVRLTVQDAMGCRYTITRPTAVNVHQAIANFTASDTLVCRNTQITFTNSSTAPGGSVSDLLYHWDFGNGTTGTDLHPVVSYPNEGLYDIRLAATDPYGCTDTLRRLAYIHVADANADFALSDSFSTCPPFQVMFTNRSVNNRSNNWDFGNGNSSTFLSPVHTYTQPGIFVIKLVVQGNGGCTDSLTKTVEIQGPSGSFTYSPLTGCPPLNVNFRSTAINTYFYTWDYRDGNSEITSSTTATHDYQIPGNYVPQMILMDSAGCKVPVVGSDTIRVVGAKAFIQGLTNYTFCDSASIQFTDSSVITDPIIRYRWQFGDGAESDLQHPSHQYTQPGRYTVSLEVWTGTNCYSTDTLDLPVIVAASPALDFSNSTPVCIPAMVQFTGVWLNSDTSTVTYKWDFGNGLSDSLLVPPPVAYNTPGVFNITLVGTSNYGCVTSVVKPLTVNDTPRVVVSPSPTVCQGSGATLTGTGADTYQWDPDPTLSCTNCASPVASPANDRVYRVTGTDVNGCRSSDTVLVKVILPGHLTVGLGDTICVGESVQLRASGFETYTWAPAAGLNNPNIANPIATPAVTTNYVVTATDSSKCFTQTDSISVVVFPIPQFNIVESIIKANLGGTVPIKTQSSADINSWLWTPAVGLSCTNCAEPIATVTVKRVYTATVSNPGGCMAKDVVTVEPYCTADNVFMPNTFSPNNDGQNDVFYPRGNGVSSIKSLMIFTRWGELIFQRKDFALNDVSAGWDGTFNGKPLSPDVYVYQMEVQCANNEVFAKKGNVTLLR